MIWRKRSFKFADTKLFRQVSDTVDGVGMQEDLDRLVEWAEKWQIQFNVSKCKVINACGEEKSKASILHE